MVCFVGEKLVLLPHFQALKGTVQTTEAEGCIQVGWYIHQNTSCTLPVDGHWADSGLEKVTYAFILLSVFKNSYMAVRLTKKHSWDALSFKRTRKITFVDIKSRKRLLFILQLSLQDQISPPCFPDRPESPVQAENPHLHWEEVMNEMAITEKRESRTIKSHSHCLRQPQ